MSAVTDAFAQLQSALTTKLSTSNGVFLPRSGGRMTANLEVDGDIIATGDIEGDFIINSQGQMVAPT